MANENNLKMEDNPSILDEANKTAARLEKANAELKVLLDRQQRQREIDVISGRSTTDGIKREPTPEEKLKLEIKDFFKGSEIEAAINKHG
jgi:hypothetical protein